MNLNKTQVSAPPLLNYNGNGQLGGEVSCPTESESDAIYLRHPTWRPGGPATEPDRTLSRFGEVRMGVYGGLRRVV